MDKRRKKGNQNSFKKISKIIPALIIFLLPGGSFLLPILAGVLDRRKTRRIPQIDNSHKNL
jgi:hypothetical protein